MSTFDDNNQSASHDENIHSEFSNDASSSSVSSSQSAITSQQREFLYEKYLKMKKAREEQDSMKRVEAERELVERQLSLMEENTDESHNGSATDVESAVAESKEASEAIPELAESIEDVGESIPADTEAEGLTTTTEDEELLAAEEQITTAEEGLPTNEDEALLAAEEPVRPRHFIDPTREFKSFSTRPLTEEYNTDPRSPSPRVDQHTTEKLVSTLQNITHPRLPSLLDEDEFTDEHVTEKMISTLKGMRIRLEKKLRRERKARAKRISADAVKPIKHLATREKALKEYTEGLKSKLSFISDPWDSLDDKITKSFHVRNKDPLFNLPFEYRRVLSDKNPAERKADSILEAANSGLLSMEEVDKMYKDLTIENSRMKRQFRQQLSPSHFTDAANLQTLDLDFEQKRMLEKQYEYSVLGKKPDTLEESDSTEELKSKKISKLMDIMRENKRDRHNLLARIHWPLSSELSRLEKLEREGILSVHDHYTGKHSNLPESVRESLKQIDLDPVLTDNQKHLKARDLITQYQFDIFEDPHEEYRKEYMRYIDTRQKLMRERMALPLSGRSSMSFQYNVTKTDELYDFAKSRGQSAAIPSPRFVGKNSVLAIAEVGRVWEMDNLDSNVLNKRLYGHFTRQFRNHLHKRRMNRRWLKKMIPKTFRVGQIYKHYFTRVIRAMK
mmetsp:Transcript_892/g.3098  ORF Transcript_892/g.3098 Transcript_892/m.3098 type:complete len:674 (-) Transcript_892:289-2310(-)